MENTDGTFTCHWCAKPFVRRYLTGRKPHYCTATCRQRAYEHRRRGARYPNHPYPAISNPPTDLAVVTHLITRLPPHPDHLDHHDLFTYLGLTEAA